MTKLSIVRHLWCPSHAIRYNRTREEEQGKKSMKLKVTLFFFLSKVHKEVWNVYCSVLWRNNKRTVYSDAWFTFSLPGLCKKNLKCTTVFNPAVWTRLFSIICPCISLSLQCCCPKPCTWGKVSLPECHNGPVFLFNVYFKKYLFMQFMLKLQCLI